MSEPRPGYLLPPRATILALSGVPETPLRRSVREIEPAPAPA